MTKRPRSESPQGQPQPHSVKAKIGDHAVSSQIDDQTVFSQLDMPVPNNALVEDTTITDDTALDKRIRETLNKDGVGRSALMNSARGYRDSYEECSLAINVLAKVLLPAIFEDNQHPEEHRDSLVASYEDTIKRHPWLVKMLVDAYSKGMYSNIRQIGLLRQLDRLSATANPFC